MISGSHAIVTAGYADIDQAKEIIRQFILNSSKQLGLGAR
jgi:hypothetical protein